MFDGLKRHWEVWKAAWAEEKERRKKKRTYIDKDFLPAALEIMEKPPSPVGRILTWSILGFFMIAVLWSVFGSVDVVAVSLGQIIPEGKVRVVQPADAGVVREIHVREGQFVKAGDPLVDLDPTFSGADQAEAKRALLAAEVYLERSEVLWAYINGETRPFQAPGDTPRELVDRQEKLIQSRIDGYESARNALVKQRSEGEHDLEAARYQLSLLEETLPLVEEQLGDRETLLEQGLTPKYLVLELRERYITQVKNIEIQKNQISKLEASIAAIDSQINQLTQEFRTTVLGELGESGDEAAIRREEYTKAVQKNSMQNLLAPVSGTVHQLTINTLGAVVEPAQALMVIVPEDEELIVEAMVLNKDIGFVQIGDQVVVKLEAFPFTKYGVIEGRLESLSTDAIQDEVLGLVYRARVRLVENKIRAEGRTVRLTPGMAATAEIKTGERRLIEFLLSPLLRYKDESLRER